MPDVGLRFVGFGNSFPMSLNHKGLFDVEGIFFFIQPIYDNVAILEYPFNADTINKPIKLIYLIDVCEIIFNFIVILKYFLRMSNRIGKRGENIFATIISRNVASRGFLFDPTFLGDKFPTIDFHVDLLQYPYKAFFYASVKTTTLGYYPGNEKIKVTVGKDESAELSKFLTP